ncbi:MAG: PAS domain-containing protein [Chitinophagaceae bacterium]|nr:PAS domain-containing protein [Chitinophagaceae bacterium]
MSQLNIQANSEKFQFLSKEGEMGRLINSIDWSKTAVGIPDNWPQSLRSTINIILESHFPMCIAWGTEFIQFYNDSYKSILGANKHPALGICFKETFAEIWDIISPMLYGVMNGKSVGLNEFMLPLNRNGYTEECYFTFSYSPIRDESGKVGGVLITIIEITEQVISRKKIEENEQRLKLAIQTTNLGTWEYSYDNDELIWSEECRNIYGLPKETKINLQVFRDYIYPEDREYVQQEIQKSKNPDSAGIYDIIYRIVQYGNNSIRWIRAQGKVFFTQEKIPGKFIGTVLDITENKNALLALENSEQRLNIAIDAAELGTWELDLVTKKIEYSKRYLEILGYHESEHPEHKEILKRIYPPDISVREQAMKDAYTTGILNMEIRLLGPIEKSIIWIKCKGKVL